MPRLLLPGLLALLLLTACAALGELPAEPVVGSPAPDFSLTDSLGQTVRLEDSLGRATVINFWATWCGPCRYEMPLLTAAAARYPDDLTVLAVNFAESQPVVQEFALDLGLGFVPLLDSDGKVYAQYQVRGLPTTFFVDAEGLIQAVHIGVLSESQLAAYLADLGLP